MIRCPECWAMLDSISELAIHTCEPTHPTPDEVKHVRTNLRKREEAEYQRTRIERAWNDYDER